MVEVINDNAGSESAESGSAVATGTAPSKPAPRKRPQQLPPFKLLLHNDDVNTVEHVVRSIVQITTMSTESALEKTLEADRTGVSMLLVTYKERAELYQEQFASFSITTTIEEA